jgi:tetratricopeptide (TPR) repeat protein
MPVTLRLLVSACTLLLTVHNVEGAQQTAGERVYSRAAEATFFLEISDSKGTTTGNASGFLVTDNQVLTNAHVASAGTVAVRVGSLRIPCTVKRTDEINDLALCELSARSNVAPLQIAASDPKPGAIVFALGNPRGLENTISQGLFTGLRQLEGRQVAQISAPISPGSSGGPILNSDGEVVAVAVSSLVSGQTLNFAVPIATVRIFLAGDSAPRGIAGLIVHSKELVTERDTLLYSDPKWADIDVKVVATLNEVVNGTTDPAVLAEVIEIASLFHPDIQATAARKALRLAKTPTREMLVELAQALYFASTDRGPSDQLREAEDAAAKAVTIGRGMVVDDVVLLANIRAQAQKLQPAIATYLQASSIAKAGSAELSGIYMGLFRATADAERNIEAQSWFKKAAANLAPRSWEWSEYARFLDSLNKYAEAGAAWNEAFKLVPTSHTFVCESAGSYYYADEIDLALPAARRCLEMSSATNDSNNIVNAHKYLADMLTDRGVYEEAANHAREAIVLAPQEALSYHYLARALAKQRRFTEVVSNERTAIRLSDGKFGHMHFTLGLGYFELKQYPEAVQAFKLAADLLPQDSAASFNVAVSYYNSQYYREAIQWYRETLRRDPNRSDKAEILRIIDDLSRR